MTIKKSAEEAGPVKKAGERGTVLVACLFILSGVLLAHRAAGTITCGAGAFILVMIVVDLARRLRRSVAAEERLRRQIANRSLWGTAW